MMLAEVILKFFNKLGLTDCENYKIYFNSQEINFTTYKTLSELGLTDFSTFEVIHSNVMG